MTLTEKLKRLDTDEMRSSGLVLSKKYSNNSNNANENNFRLSNTFKGSVNENADDD